MMRLRRIWTLILAVLLAAGGTLLHHGGVADANDAGPCLFGPPSPGARCMGADLRGVQFPDADLTGAHFTGAALTDANLTGAELGRAGLTGADLRGADLTGADLTGAVLVGADLTGAKLAGATLRGAILVGTKLDGADLSHADFTEANLTGASWHGATLTGTHLPAPTQFGPAPWADGSTSASGSTTAADPGDSVGHAVAGGSQTTFRLCGAAAPDTDRAIEQFLAGTGFGATLVGRADGCADLTVTRARGGASAGQQSTNLRVSSGAAGGGWIVVRISSEDGTTRVSTS